MRDPLKIGALRHIEASVLGCVFHSAEVVLRRVRLEVCTGRTCNRAHLRLGLLYVGLVRKMRGVTLLVAVARGLRDLREHRILDHFEADVVSILCD
jgi:hypothetical protein